MGFQVSPGVQVKEIDLTNVIPAVSTSIGAIAGAFQWGPVGEIITVGSEKELVSRFGKPNNDTYQAFMPAASFLKYGRSLRVIRADASVDATFTQTEIDAWATEDIRKDIYGENITSEDQILAGPAKNASSGVSHETIPNDAAFEAGVWSDLIGSWAAKFPGAIANGMEVFVVQASDRENYQQLENTAETTFLNAADALNLAYNGGDTVTITAAKVAYKAAKAAYETASFNMAIIDQFDIDPDPADTNGDFEVNIAVVDVKGMFGIENGVLEKYALLSTSETSLGADGSNNYFVEVINSQSNYIRSVDTSKTALQFNEALVGGTVGTSVAADNSGTWMTPTKSLDIGDLTTGFGFFADTETVDVSLIIQGTSDYVGASHGLANQLIALATTRKDCVAFVSPPIATTKQNPNATTDLIEWADKLTSSSYGVIDSTALYVYDKYSDLYRWISASGAVAGLCAKTDDVADPWWSPAGFNRGQLFGVTKLAFNPKHFERDELYKKRINPIVTFPGEGTLLYGDKTAQSKPSAFDRINVRRLFIVLEKAIATAAKYQLFEFNDEFTRAQFRNMVEPFLRDVKGRRGLYDFHVVCDETNNTGQVIDTNQFIADIYIKPARSINFMTLNFIATRTGVEFSEIIGK
jgi:phage tail sheath protein FI